ncbi:hypothetical protein ACWDCC_41200 [Streptomyces sp. NPDC001102]
MSTQHHAAPACGVVSPSWRMGAFAFIQIVIVVLVVAGCPVQTALGCAAGGGMAAAHVVRALFGLPLPAGEGR